MSNSLTFPGFPVAGHPSMARERTFTLYAGIRAQRSDIATDRGRSSGFAVTVRLLRHSKSSPQFF